MQDDVSEVRKSILALVRRFHNAGAISRQKPFSPGERINYAGRVYGEEELVALVDSSLDFWLTAGRFADQFESGLAKYIGAKHALFVNSGSSANLVAASALTSHLFGKRRLMPGDEVITTASSFPTTVNPIFQNGAVPVFIDTVPGTYNLDVSRLEEAYSDKAKAVMVAHTLGNPFDLDAVTSFCRKHGLFLIEDCCDALGATWGGRKVGTFGDLATLSFYPAHHITTGEGGAVLTSSDIAKRCAESFRDWGRDCWCKPGCDNTCGKRFAWKLGGLPFGYDHKYIYSHIGYNLKATDMQAAVGCEQLKRADGFVEARRGNHAYLYSSLKDYSDVFILPEKLAKAEPSPFGFALSVREGAGFSKNDIVAYLEKKNIATRNIFAGNIVRQPAYMGRAYRIVGELAGSDFIMNSAFWVGVYPGMDKPRLEYISGAFHDFMKEKKPKGKGR
ncbi:MAG: lipopolysaccharide biosynthesis protein RfbH [Candidatus Micrarchaeia archaeon]|jgi:CDP-6-deoxy-D-xylo-4-hexulose-3-dehydrase